MRHHARRRRIAAVTTAALLVAVVTLILGPGVLSGMTSGAAAESPGLRAVPASGTLSLPGGAVTAAAIGQQAYGPDWTTITSDGFEGTFPATGWQVAPAAGEYVWGRRSCGAHGGSYSALAHGGGTVGSGQPCGTPYPTGIAADHLIYGPFSLEGATAAEWSFWLDLNTQQDGDKFYYWVSTNNNNYFGTWIYGTTSGFEQVTLDLANVPGLGSLLGQPQVWIAFSFYSDATALGRGATVDDVLLRAHGAGASQRLTFLPLSLGQHPLEQASRAVSGTESAIIATTSGVSVTVPQGAVSATADGGTGTMTFSVEQVANPSPLPSGYTAMGSAYAFGPSGFSFSKPVQVTFPVAAGVDMATAGIMVYDEATGQWLPAPATTNATLRTVSTETQHFTMYRGVQSEALRDQARFYWSTSRGLGGENLYGTWVCVASATLSSGASTAGYSWPQWSPSVPMASDAPWEHSLPKGQYTFYYRWAGPAVADSRFAQTGIVDITSSTPNTVSLMVPPSGGISVGYPPCLGALGGGQPDPSVGTGEVQVTLNWDTTVDLDLHVTEPSGEQIYYLHRYSGSNGQLDLDNKCGDFVLGRPENIFWPPAGSGGAPSGHYLIQVVWYESCGGGVTEVPFSVRVVIRGRVFTFRKLFSGQPDPNGYMTVAQCEKTPVGGGTPICW